MAPSTVAELNTFLADKSYMVGYAFSDADVATFAKFGLPCKVSAPHAYRWYVHVAALSGVKCLAVIAAAGAPAAAPAKAAAKAAAPAAAKAAAPVKAAAAEEEEEEDWFAEDEEVDPEVAAAAKKNLEEAKAKANAKIAAKELNQRSLCVLEIKPWEAEQDLMVLFNKIKTTIQRDGLKWSENCELQEVAYGVKKILLTAVIGVNLSMDAVIEEICEDLFPDEVQSMNMLSMSLL